VDDIPLDVRDKLELIAVETMDEVFACALSRVILPQHMNGAFTIDDVALAEDPDSVADNGDAAAADDDEE
jgi:hypothetical protein